MILVDELTKAVKDKGVKVIEDAGVDDAGEPYRYILMHLARGQRYAELRIDPFLLELAKPEDVQQFALVLVARLEKAFDVL